MIGRLDRFERCRHVAEPAEILRERAARQTGIEMLTKLRQPDRPQRAVDHFLDGCSRLLTRHGLLLCLLLSVVFYQCSGAPPPLALARRPRASLGPRALP